MVDTIINNAGHGLQGSFLDQTLDDSLNMISLDIASLTAITRLFAEDMKIRRKGHILMVSSLLAYQGVENFAVYSAAKAYILRFSGALHRELKGCGITVTALCPGMSDTGFAKVARQKLTPALKGVMMQPKPVVFLTWATPRWLHQAIMSRVMGV